MEWDWRVVFLVVSLCTVLAILSYHKRILNKEGSFAAFGVGMVIGIFGDIVWLFLLLIFLLTSFLATKYRFSLKESLGVQEGLAGERGGGNVIADGTVPAIVAIVTFIANEMSLPHFSPKIGGILFITAISAGAADTLASEIGVLSDRAFLITTMEKVTPGTNGGVSRLGHLSAFVASTYTSIVGWLILRYLSSTMLSNPLVLLIPLVLGFLGCQVDSVFGATLENAHIIGKKTNNFLSISLVTAMAWVVTFLVL